MMLGKIEGQGRRKQQRMRRLDNITDLTGMIEQTLGNSDG